MAGTLALLLLGDERLSDYVSEISHGAAKAYTSAVNLAELYYKTVDKVGLQTAETWYFRVLNSNVIIAPADATLAREVSIYKSKYKRSLSLADCFAMALSIKEKATLLTRTATSRERER
ncbi:MAG: hypothetical protein AOA65_1292 [Candidatus Bathyarchaeota archaeon BA1]|nr:MAG: hypothetical protein AOA65_1292 [Candidatus Bathyarchaeota archaeon BA1]